MNAVIATFALAFRWLHHLRLHLLWLLPGSIQIFQINIVHHHLLLPFLKEVLGKKKLCIGHARKPGGSSGHGFFIVKVKMCCFVVYVFVPLKPKESVK